MLAFVSLPFFFESALHRSQVETRLSMTPWPLAVRIGAPIAGRLAGRVSAAVLGAAGLVVLCAGLALLAGLPENPTAAEIAWRTALCGLGSGFFQAPNNRLMLSAAPLARSGGGSRHARYRASYRADHRRNSRRDLVPDRRPFRDNSARHGGSVGRHRSGSQRGQALSSGGRAPGGTSNRRRRAVAAPVFESDERLSATAQSP
jgi:hypothetical protein